jgi:hybrid cluster-associated redox disulfide protein
MITKDMLIGEILENKAGAANVLMANGMGCLGCPSSQMESLDQAAVIHGLNVETLLEQLNK